MHPDQHIAHVHVCACAHRRQTNLTPRTMSAILFFVCACVCVWLCDNIVRMRPFNVRTTTHKHTAIIPEHCAVLTHHHDGQEQRDSHAFSEPYTHERNAFSRCFGAHKCARAFNVSAAAAAAAESTFFARACVFECRFTSER